MSDLSIDRRRRALAAAGLDPDAPMRAAPSYSNEVWIGAEVVVRINHPGLLGGNPARLLREAALAARLPPAARYPEILGSGADAGMAWLALRRVPGVELGRAWRTMSATARERAIGQLAEALSVLHAVPCDDITGDDIEPPHTLPLAPLLALVEEAIAEGGDSELLRETAAFVRERWAAFDDTGLGLVHGDPHLENWLWDGAQVSAMLDLEWSRRSWFECDLEILLSIADHPALFVAADYEHEVDRADYADLARWLAAAQPRWFAHPRVIDRLEVLHVSRTLGAIVEEPRHATRTEHLRRVLAGTSPFRCAGQPPPPLSF
jgi:hypothetical protein